MQMEMKVVAGVAVLCGGSEHTLDSMCLTKAAKLVIDWWLSTLWKLLDLHSWVKLQQKQVGFCIRTAVKA